MLYPLKFEPIYKERIWGGTRLRECYDRMCPEEMLVGESWELSGLEEGLSVVSCGALEGNNIQELIEVYMGDLVGERVYERFGLEFPLLVKFLDAKEALSVQVHPDNDLAAERHNSYGKSEMWYVMHSEPGAEISLGFNKDTDSDEYLSHLANGSVGDLLQKEKPSKGSVYFIPAGTIHSLGKGIFLAEIQQTSDITYRVFDWNRTDEKGKSRELHTEMAVGALNFSKAEGLDIKTNPEPNEVAKVLSTPFFATNIIDVQGAVERDYADLDSFVIYICVEGSVIVECEGGAESIMDAETVLLPAMFENARLSGRGRVLEVYIPKE